MRSKPWIDRTPDGWIDPSDDDPHLKEQQMNDWDKLSDAQKIEVLRAGMNFFAECFRGLATHFVAIAGELEKTYGTPPKIKAENIAEVWRRFQKPEASQPQAEASTDLSKSFTVTILVSPDDTANTLLEKAILTKGFDPQRVPDFIKSQILAVISEKLGSPPTLPRELSLNFHIASELLLTSSDDDPQPEIVEKPRQ